MEYHKVLFLLVSEDQYFITWLSRAEFREWRAFMLIHQYHNQDQVINI